MKKIVSLALAVLMIFTFVACGEKEETKSDKVDLKYYSQLGQIPEVEYKLGADCKKVQKELSDKYELPEDFIITFSASTASMFEIAQPPPVIQVVYKEPSSSIPKLYNLSAIASPVPIASCNSLKFKFSLTAIPCSSQRSLKFSKLISFNGLSLILRKFGR